MHSDLPGATQTAKLLFIEIEHSCRHEYLPGLYIAFHFLVRWHMANRSFLRKGWHPAS